MTSPSSPTPAAKNPKPLRKSMTVWSSLATALSWVGVEYTDLADPEKMDYQRTILIIGVALISIFMRRAIPTDKSIFASRTFWSSVFMGGGYVASRQMEAAPGVSGAIVIFGLLGIIIFMRSAIKKIYGDPS